jgi:AcrR family transcriptional regulator
MKRRSQNHSLDKRKRPLQRRSIATVDAIVEAAARILETRGHEGFSTNAVAERAGISIGSLYQYFPNKAAIVRALIERESSLLRDGICSVELRKNPKEALNQMIEVAVRHQLRRPALARMLDVEEARLPVSKRFQSAGRDTIRRFEKCLLLMDAATSETLPIITRDVMSIIRAIKDSADRSAQDSNASFIARVQRAVHGYLSHKG